MRNRADPVFLLGAPRSGTTLLYRCLALHPGAAWISNYQRRFPRGWPVAVLNRATRHTPAWTYAAWFGPEGDAAYRYSAARSAAERWWPQPVEGEPLFATHGLPPAWDSGSVPARAADLRVLIDRTTAAAGGRVFLSKRIAHNRRIPLLHALWPDARFLVLTRDGRAVSDSLVRVDWWPRTELWWWRAGAQPADWVADGRDALEAAARHWLAESDAIEEGLRGIPPDHVSRMAYEDLVATPRPALAEAARFARLDPRAGAWQRACAAIDFADRNSAWGDALDPSRMAALALLTPRLEELGYRT
ncbi:MAG: sulfotransferase [Dermatophilaceae bacterium]